MSKETYTETFRLEKRPPDFDTYFSVEERPIYTRRDVQKRPIDINKDFQKRPIYVKRDLNMSKETYTHQERHS